MAGRRGEDYVLGLGAAGTLGDASIYGDLAAFFLPDDVTLEHTAPADDRVLKGTAGLSYGVPIGTGLRLFAEYHFNGFGVEEPTEALTLLASEEMLMRYQRGDFVTLARHTLSAITSYDLGDTVSADLMGLIGLSDGSALLAPSLTWSVSERLTLIGSGFVPLGEEPEDGVTQSEYGSYPTSVFVQVRIYD